MDGAKVSSEINSPIHQDADKTKGTVALLVTLSDKEGEVTQVISSYEDCKVFDESNWNCEAFVGNKVQSNISMRDGTLKLLLYGAQQTFTKRRKVLGLTF